MGHARVHLITAKKDMEVTGFEPEASRMQSERSTAELYPQSESFKALKIIKMKHTKMPYCKTLLTASYCIMLGSNTRDY